MSEVQRNPDRKAQRVAGVGSDGDAMRDRILHEAAVLFSHRGYDGVSTRDIASACKIRQPSLYWYFPSKRAIMGEIIEMDLLVAVAAVRWLATTEASPAAKLYRFLHVDMTHLSTNPLNLILVYNTNILEHAEFADINRRARAIPQFHRRVIKDGIVRGQFVDLPVSLLQEFLVGVDVHTGRMSHTRGIPKGVEIPDVLATLALRGVLAEPAGVEQVRSEAMALEPPAKMKAALAGIR